MAEISIPPKFCDLSLSLILMSQTTASVMIHEKCSRISSGFVTSTDTLVHFCIDEELAMFTNISLPEAFR